MNKAFLREPEADTRVFCPCCTTEGLPVGIGPLDSHIRPEFRAQMPEAAWYCPHPPCDVAYFTVGGAVVMLGQLRAPVYPYEMDAPICACFKFGYDDVEADVRDGTPTRIRELLGRSQSPEARCAVVAVDGQCCMKEIQRLYLKLRAAPG